MTDSQNKNKLQEYCQKNNFPLPKYTTQRVGGTDNRPEWSSYLTLHNGKQYKGEICSRAKTAEFSAAKVALDDIINETQNTADDIVLFKNCIISNNKISRKVLIVDLENLHKILDNITEKELLDDTLKIYVFVGEHHDLVDKVFPNKIVKIISPSTRPDGTDTCIQVHVGIFLSCDLFDDYYIATRDKFGSNLVDIITSNNFGWKNKKAKIVTKLSQLY